jgi:RNA polymerase sigma-70 factor, ECF subfamily
MSEPSDPNSRATVTQLLIGYSKGDQSALNEMLPLVYNELKRLASYYLNREREGHTLQTTALVHEAYLRLVDQQQVDWKNRSQFLGLAAEMMRRILLNHARDRNVQKRGGDAKRVSLH